MSDDSLDDLVRDYSTNDARRDKHRADARREFQAWKKQLIAYESLRNCCPDLLEKKHGHPLSNDAYLLELAKCITAAHAVLTDEARGRLKERLDTLDGAKRLACELLLSDHTTADVFAKLQKASKSSSLLKMVTDWLHSGPEDILG